MYQSTKLCLWGSLSFSLMLIMKVTKLLSDQKKIFNDSLSFKVEKCQRRTTVNKIVLNFSKLSSVTELL